MQKVKTVFFGTQEFATTILQGLLDSNIVSVETVFTQPDKKVGRKQTIEESPVKKLALKYNIPVEQPESLKNCELRTENCELAIVAQYGLMIPKKIIDSFPKGTINVHGSLLPTYRGASPIQMALVNGEKETGVTIMLMDEKMDHGSILSQKKMVIDPDDTYTTLAAKMAVEGSNLLVNTLPQWLSGELKAQEQNENQATFTKLLSKEDGLVDFNKTNDEIYNQYRGLTPWPGIWCMRNNKRLKLLKIAKSDKNITAGEPLAENKRIFIGCSQGSIEILELQLEGKGSMDAASFLNGYKI
ncbi:MAG TPA: methionyl-tRNA formyltransferase [Candidatus Udaeobacter sp.]|nr:methionyl-tRNA formyltransferase [Candidatus Udaeobacter sp.]